MANFSDSSFSLMASLQRLNSEVYLDQPVDAEAMQPSGSWRPNDGSRSDLTDVAPAFSTTTAVFETASDQGDGGQATRRLVCPFCSKVFSDRRNFYRHRMVHTNDRPFQCPLCQYRSSRKSNVQRHMASRHYSPTADHLEGSLVDDGSSTTLDQV